LKIFLINPGMVDDYAYELASGLSKSGSSVYLFGGTDYTDKEITFKNFNYYNYFFNVNKIKSKFLKKNLKFLLYIYLQFHILFTIKKEKPDIIHLQWARVPILDMLFISLFKKYVPVIFTLHNTTLNHGDNSSAGKILFFGFKRFLRKTSSIILHTKYSKEKFSSNYSAFIDKAHIIPHGLLSFPPSKKIKKFDFSFHSSIVLLFFGNIEKYKGLDILINALSYLKDERVELLIAGRPNIPIEPYIKLSEDLNVSNMITWHPFFIDDDDVSEIFDNGDLVILPHRNIDQSGVLMSSINFDKPIVASDIGGFSETIENGKHGYLFKLGDSKDLASKILTIIKNNKIDTMSNEVNILKKSWETWEEISNRTLQLYNKVIKH